uniref:DNA 5'-3' helicase n=1 Tax=viral metagenome TaxID=1070528 RepID=A0A6M3KU28_9ZZZZ
MDSDRILPHAVGVEKAVLGGVMLGGVPSLDEARAVLRPESFYHTAHRKIFKALCHLGDNGGHLDQVSVVEMLQKHGVLEDSGGPAYVFSLVGEMATSANVEYHSGIVNDRYVRRLIIDRSSRLQSMAYEAEVDLAELTAASDFSSDLETGLVEGSWSTIGEAGERAVESIVDTHENPDKLPGIPSGLTALDDLTTGFQDSELTLVAARPSIGKTAWALQVALNAGKSGLAVAVVSVEMSEMPLAKRLLVTDTGVDGQGLRRGRLPAGDLERVKQAAAAFRGLPVYLSDKLIRPTQIAVEVRKLARKVDLKLIIIDYLQLMEGDGPRNESREREVASIGGALKKLAKSMDVPVIALAQLNRGIEARQDRRPKLSDLRESGFLEQVADLVVFLHRPEGEDHANEMELIIGKQRNGPVGSVTVYYEEKTGRFGDLEKRYDGQDEGAAYRAPDAGGVPKAPVRDDRSGGGEDSQRTISYRESGDRPGDPPDWVTQRQPGEAES